MVYYAMTHSELTYILQASNLIRLSGIEIVGDSVSESRVYWHVATINYVVSFSVTVI